MALRDLTQFHENAAVIDWWRRVLGRSLVWLTPPRRRRAILAVAALLVGIVTTLQTIARNKGLPVPSHGFGAGLVVLAQFALLWLVYRAAARFAQWPGLLRRNPQWTLHGCYWALLVVVWLSAPSDGLWRSVLLGLAIMVPALIWRCSYMVLAGQHGRMKGTGITDHLFYLWPAYGGSDTPYGKGLAYLSQFEAKTTDELARSQLAGIKLILLAVLWRLVLTAFEGLVYGPGNRLTQAIGGHTLGLPELQNLLVLGAQAPLAQSWAGIYCEMFEHVLRLAIKGHLIVGALRLYGFNVFRNTYKPLLAESVVEFWNRYFYYFKELLSTFFFLPTFTGFGRRLSKWPKLRLLAAVFAAALVGNVYYHLIRESVELAQGHGWQVVYAQRSRMFYCLLLAVGLYVSMLREQGRRGETASAGRAPRWLRIFGVWTFFAMVFIWDAEGGAPFLSRVHFFLGLFGLGGG